MLFHTAKMLSISLCALSLITMICAPVYSVDAAQNARQLNENAKTKLRELNYKEALAEATKAEKLLKPAMDKINIKSVGYDTTRYQYDDALSWEILACAALGDENGALAAIKKINRKPIGNCGAHIQLSGAYAQVGENEFQAGKKDSAKKFLEKSIAVYRTWQNQTDDLSGKRCRVLQVPGAPTCTAMIRLGEMYMESGKQEEGKKLVQQGHEWLKTKGLIQ